MKTIFSFLSFLISIFLLAGCSGNERAGSDVSPETSGSGSLTMDSQPETASSFLSGVYVDPSGSWDLFDSLIEEIRSERDPVSYIELLHEADDMLLKTGCVIPLYDMRMVYLSKDTSKVTFTDPFMIDHYDRLDSDDGTGSVRFGVARMPVPDPAYAVTSDDLSVIANCYSGLFSYDDGGAVVPACVDRYETSEDGSTYTFYLKEDLRWADGLPVTANDFIFAWERTAKTNKRYGRLFSFIEGYPDGLSLHAESEYVLSMKVSHPCDRIEALLAFPVFVPVRKDAVEADPEHWYLSDVHPSNGVYTWNMPDPARSMVLIPGPEESPADEGSIRRTNVEFTVFPSDDAAYSAYRAGEVDILKSVPINVSMDMIYADDPEVKIVSVYGITLLDMNSKSPLFSKMSAEESVCFRIAVSMLIDKDYLVKEMVPDGRSTARSCIPEGMHSGAKGAQYVSDDDPIGLSRSDADDSTVSDQVVRLLSLAGFSMNERGNIDTSQLPVLKCLCPDTPVCRETMESVSQDLASIGIRLTFEPADMTSYYRKARSGAYDIVLEQRIAVYDDPVCLLEGWTSGSAENYCLFGDS